ncbi:MAG: hypothetical protein OXC00_05620 [Acidimicrobiaceae bacterium]|nr:hypothetical protein [Acidimicrobiaceae bacterium]
MGTRFDGWNRCPPGRSGQAGLITLEWLLIVGTIAGLAASTTLIVQRVLDDHSEVPPDPVVRFIQADIEAAEIATEAQADFDADPSAYDNDGYENRCEGLKRAFIGLVMTASWALPSIGPDNTAGTVDDEAARCSVTPERGLGG